MSAIGVVGLQEVIEKSNYFLSIYEGPPCIRIRVRRYRCGRPHTQGFSFELRHTMELILARVFLHLLSDIIDLAGLSFQ